MSASKPYTYSHVSVNQPHSVELGLQSNGQYKHGATYDDNHQNRPNQRIFTGINKRRKDKNPRRRFIRRQCGAFALMSFLVLLPTFLYAPLSFLQDESWRNAKYYCQGQDSGLSFFEPDILMGKFSLGEAKAIDSAWNLVIGRGAQLVMACGAYPIIMQTLVRVLEGSPVDARLFARLVFEPGSLRACWTLVRHAKYMQGWRARAAVIWLAYSTVSMLAMPALFDFGTGYARLSGLVWVGGTGDDQNAYFEPYDKLPASFPGGTPGPTTFLCVASSTYQWGFGMRPFCLLMGVWSVWVFGLYVCWVDAQHNSRVVQNGNRIGEWTACVQLNELIEQGGSGGKPEGYSEKGLEKWIKKGYSLKYEVSEAMVDNYEVRISGPRQE